LREGAGRGKNTGERYRADLALFDPATVAAGSTFEAPRTLPVGIPHVRIDVRFVIEDGRRTSVLAGRAVRSTRSSGSVRGSR
jgi:N-acyl-D-amino-acid deacylase